MTINAADVPGGEASLNERTGVVTYKETKDAFSHIDGTGGSGIGVGGTSNLVTQDGPDALSRIDGNGAYGIAVG